MSWGLHGSTSPSPGSPGLACAEQQSEWLWVARKAVYHRFPVFWGLGASLGLCYINS